MIKFNPDEYGRHNVELNRYNTGPNPDDPESDTLHVVLTYPPRSDENPEGKIRYIHFDQESVRASDGVRLHYDYNRDGVVVEQYRTRYVKIRDSYYNTVYDWTEVGFFQSWALEDQDDDMDLIEDAKFAAADAEFEAKKGND